MARGMEVGHGPRDFVFVADRATPRTEGMPTTTQFLAHVYCGQTAGWTKTPRTEVDLVLGRIVLDGVPALRETGTAAPHLFGPCLLWQRSPISATAELLLYIHFFGSHAHPNGILPGVKFTKSYVLLYWQCYCTTLEQWASAKLCGVVQGMELRKFRRRRHVYIQGGPKSGHPIYFAITLPILDRFAIFFTAANSSKFPRKPILGYPPHLKYVATLPWKT